jgi:hypothetical protein
MDWHSMGQSTPTEFFDIRLPPEQQLSTNLDGTLISVGSPRAVSGETGQAWFAHARDDAPDNVTFLAKDTETQSGYLADYGIPLEFTLSVSFEPGDTVGPDSIEGSSLVIVTNLYSDVAGQNYAPVDVIGDGFTFGLAIQEPDGVHYGWITLEREYPQNLATNVYERFRVVRYAYELQPGVPALVSAPPCLADTNNDGSVTPADFSAWVAAFNTNAPECDQNDDNACTPADFSAWVANYNAGC